MLDKVKQLQGIEDGEGRRFEAWRVKNTHHPAAVVVGGYRDVKLVGIYSVFIMYLSIYSVFIETKLSRRRPPTRLPVRR